MTQITMASSSQKITDLMLRHDWRGISALRPFLPPDHYMQTATFALQHLSRVMIATGFYVNGSSETDGPPGALALVDGFMQLGSQVTIISDQYCLPVLERVHPACHLVEFPIANPEESRRYAESILAQTQPTLLIAVERCGLTRDGSYRNMRGIDITPYTARLDELFINQKNTIGIGDGGNEIGMGLLYEQLIKLPDLVAYPSVTATTHLLIATVSNWGAYGLLGAMSITCSKMLLPNVERQSEILHEIVRHGATNGVNGHMEYMVDGFDEAINNAILEDLHLLVQQQIRTD